MRTIGANLTADYDIMIIRKPTDVVGPLTARHAWFGGLYYLGTRVETAKKGEYI